MAKLVAHDPAPDAHRPRIPGRRILGKVRPDRRMDAVAADDVVGLRDVSAVECDLDPFGRVFRDADATLAVVNFDAFLHHAGQESLSDQAARDADRRQAIQLDATVQSSAQDPTGAVGDRHRFVDEAVRSEQLQRPDVVHDPGTVRGEGDVAAHVLVVGAADLVDGRGDALLLELQGERQALPHRVSSRSARCVVGLVGSPRARRQ